MIATLALACTTTAHRAAFQPVQGRSAQELAKTTDQSAPFVKAHLKDGGVVVLEYWSIRENTLSGRGIAYDRDRSAVHKGELNVPLNGVVLLETNRPERFKNTNIAVLAVLSGVSLVMTAVCLGNPKACFGSCPTFYAPTASGIELQAEGFSASVAKALEETDIDALFTAAPSSGRFVLVMTNEALETHLVRSVRLLAAPRNGAARVLRAGDAYYAAKTLTAPSACISESGDCLEAVRNVDQAEYLSPADARDLAARERITLTFPASRGRSRDRSVRPQGGDRKRVRRGLLIAARNSLLNTFVFYQALAYMGRRAGELMAALERGGLVVDATRGVGRRLGDVEAKARTRGGPWVPVGAFSEVGPIAREVQLLLLPETLGEGELEVELELTRGNWKIDQVALAELGDEVTPTRLDPVEVQRAGKVDPRALARLLDPEQYLVTYPGDRYEIVYELPGAESELFLESTGYYYEWIRSEWLPEENEDALRLLLTNPERALRELAPSYKRIEPHMERLFWQSRIRAGATLEPEAP